MRNRKSVTEATLAALGSIDKRSGKQRPSTVSLGDNGYARKRGGSVQFYVRKVKNGKEITEPIGTWNKDGLTLDVAKVRLVETNKRLNLGETLSSGTNKKTTLKEDRDRFIDWIKGTWRDYYKQQWITRWDKYCGHLNDTPTVAISDKMILDAVKEVYTERHSVGRLVKGQINSVFAYARDTSPARFIGTTNPCISAWKHLPKMSNQIATHRIALTDHWLPKLYKFLDEEWFDPMMPLFQFMLLTPVGRQPEYRDARWKEIDWDARIWHLPPGRAKNSKKRSQIDGGARRIPLTDDALALLRRLQATQSCHGPDNFIFQRGGEIRMIEGKVYRPEHAIGIDMPMRFVHKVLEPRFGAMHLSGLRAAFATWVGDYLDQYDKAKEIALDHGDDNLVYKAYTRSDRFIARRVLSEFWNCFLKTGELPTGVGTGNEDDDPTDIGRLAARRKEALDQETWKQKNAVA
jgi:integrase